MAQAPVPHDSHTSLVLRLFWMVAGNVILFLCLTSVIHSHARALGLVDLGYWLTVLAMIAARWVDIRFHHGDTVTGEPATMHHWRKYAAALPSAALAAWILIHLLALTGIA